MIITINIIILLLLRALLLVVVSACIILFSIYICNDNPPSSSSSSSFGQHGTNDFEGLQSFYLNQINAECIRIYVYYIIGHSQCARASLINNK